MHRSPLSLFLALLALLPLVACGGGGSGGSSDDAGLSHSVDAGADQATAEGTVVTLNAAVTDPDGAAPDLLWTQTGGPAVGMNGTTTDTCTFQAPMVDAGGLETLSFSCTATTPEGAVTDTVDVLVSSGAFIVYTAEPGGETADSLFASPARGGAPLRLSPAPVGGGGVSTSSNFEVSPNGRMVAWRDDAETIGASEIFVADIGPTPDARKVSPTFAHGDADAFWDDDAAWSPDSSRLLMRADDQVDFDTRGHVAFGLGAALPRTSPVPGNQNSGDIVLSLFWSPDGSRAAARVRDGTTNEIGLVTCSPTGGSNRTLVANDVSVAFWSPQSDRLVVIGDVETPGVNEVYVVSDAGGAPVKISGAMVQNGDASSSTGRTLWSPGGTHVLYVADQDVDGQQGVYVSSADGQTNVRVSGTPLHAGFVTVREVHWSADGSRIVYSSDELADDETRVFSVRPNGADRVELARPPSASDTIVASAIVGGSQSVAWLVRAGASSEDDSVWLRAADGSSAPIRLTPPDAGDGASAAFAVSPDGSRLAFCRIASGSVVAPSFTRTCAPDGSDVRVVFEESSSELAHTTVRAEHWSPDSARLVLVVRETVPPGVLETRCFTVRADGTDRQDLDAPAGASGAFVFANAVWALPR